MPISKSDVITPLVLGAGGGIRYGIKTFLKYKKEIKTQKRIRDDVRRESGSKVPEYNLVEAKKKLKKDLVKNTIGGFVGTTMVAAAGQQLLKHNLKKLTKLSSRKKLIKKAISLGMFSGAKPFKSFGNMSPMKATMVGSGVGAGIGAIGGFAASKKDPQTGQRMNVGRNIALGAGIGGIGGGLGAGKLHELVKNNLPGSKPFVPPTIKPKTQGKMSKLIFGEKDMNAKPSPTVPVGAEGHNFKVVRNMTGSDKKVLSSQGHMNEVVPKTPKVGLLPSLKNNWKKMKNFDAQSY